jgi:hypothetical protein
MRSYTIYGIIFVATGVLLLAYQGMLFMNEEMVARIEPAQAMKDGLPLNSIMGALALAGGVALLVHGKQEVQRRVKAAQLRRWLL